MLRARPWILPLIATLALTAGCGGQRAATSERSSAGSTSATPGSMSATETKAYLAEHPETLILDVRNPQEWNDDVGHIEGAKLIPLPELPTRLSELEVSKGKPIIAVCRVGARSAAAAEMLARNGYSPVFNLEGGMEAWRKAGY